MSPLADDVVEIAAIGISTEERRAYLGLVRDVQQADEFIGIVQCPLGPFQCFWLQRSFELEEQIVLLKDFKWFLDLPSNALTMKCAVGNVRRMTLAVRNRLEKT
jgi:hypothetical protein